MLRSYRARVLSASLFSRSRSANHKSRSCWKELLGVNSPGRTFCSIRPGASSSSSRARSAAFCVSPCRRKIELPETEGIAHGESQHDLRVTHLGDRDTDAAFAGSHRA